ncbi:MAG: helix-turn-helix domain-containing protein [Actinomycetota bacterium]|nr:helix-turn-helix domain-containing protein [Actinomycetota bacterium]
MTDRPAPVFLEDVRDRSPEILRAFQEVAVQATSVSEPEHLDELLRLVGRRVCELLDVNRFSAYIRGDDGFFYGQVGYCRTADIDDRIKKLVTGTDRFTQEIVATRAPVLVTDARNDPRTVQRTMREWGVRDMLGVPLVFNAEAIGIIYVDNEDEDHVYTDEQIRVAQAFGSLAALAVRQASLYAQLNRRALVIDRQRRLLEQVALVHKRLTDAALRGADVPQTIKLLSDLMGKPVILFSSGCEVAATAAPPGVDAAPLVERSNPAQVAAMARERTRGAAVILPAAPHAGLPHRQLVCPLKADEEIVGHLAVVELGSSIRPIDVKVVEQGATLVTLLVIAERRQAEAEGQAREDFLSDLLHGGREPSVLQRRAPLFGVDLDRPHVVVRLALAAEPGLPGSERRALLAARMATLLGGDAPLAISVPGADMLLLALPEGHHQQALGDVRRAVESLIDEMATRIRFRGAAVSKVARRIEDYAEAHRELRALLEATRVLADGHPRVVLATELGVLRLVVAGSGADSRQFAEELLGPLRRYDEETQSELLPTLRRYLECGAQVRATARALAVHENTVRYRLTRIAEVSAVDPNDLRSLLDVRFALQIIDLATN